MLISLSFDSIDELREWMDRVRIAPPSAAPAAHDTPVDVLGITTMSLNTLKADGICTVGDLLARGESGLLRLPNFGRKQLHDVIVALAKRGIAFTE